MKKKALILSIDGGGIRGIIPAVILKYIEEQLQKKGNEKTLRLADYFDLFAGTSTGGILTCAYLTPDENGKPKYSAKDALDFYLERGDEIFDVSFKKKIISMGGVLDEKFDADELEDALNDYFGNNKLSGFIKPCLITAYDIRRRETKFFNKLDAVNSDINNYWVKDIARATSAAPVYFEPKKIKSLFGTTYPLIDGGVFANNPAMCAYSEARTIDFKKITNDLEKPVLPGAKDMLILSLGTGSKGKPYYYKDAKNWGALKWIKPIIDILMAGNAETVDYQLKQIFDTLNDQGKESYIRIEPDLYNADPAMDDASIENMNKLEEAGMNAVTKHRTILDNVVDKLIENK